MWIKSANLTISETFGTAKAKAIGGWYSFKIERYRNDQFPPIRWLGNSKCFLSSPFKRNIYIYIGNVIPLAPFIAPSQPLDSHVMPIHSP